MTKSKINKNKINKNTTISFHRCFLGWNRPHPQPHPLLPIRLLHLKSIKVYLKKNNC